MVLSEQMYFKIKGTNNSSGGTTPVGIIEITENGTHDVTNYAVANVNVPVPDGYIMPSGTLEVSGNGTHNVKEYESVNVNVESESTANGLPLEVDSLPISKSAVPNSGYVENVYFNTSLSVEEVVSIIENANLTFIYDFMYGVFSNSDASVSVVIYIDNGEYIIKNPNSNTTYFTTTQTIEGEDVGFIGWNPDFNGVIEANVELVNDLGGMSLGTQNEALKDLIYVEGESAGVEGAIYKVGSEPTAVPNTGTVEKVYFNTALSVEEVVSVLSNLTLNYGGVGEAFLLTSNNSSCILCLNNGGVWLIYEEYTGYCYFESSKLEFDFIGWNPDFNGVIEVNENVVSEIEGISIGTQNEALKNLFSITPFGGSDYYLCENGSFTKLVKE